MNRFGFSVTPIYRKTREVQFAAGGRQIAQTFPLIDTRMFGFHLLDHYRNTTKRFTAPQKVRFRFRFSRLPRPLCIPLKNGFWKLVMENRI